jgi:hypothetical protein
MLILAVPFHLRRASLEVGNSEARFPEETLLDGGADAQVPGVHKAVDSAGCQDIWVMSRKVDVSDGALMSRQREFWLMSPREFQIEDEGFLVSSSCNAPWPTGEGAPLDIGNVPLGAVHYVARRGIRAVQIDNKESTLAGEDDITAAWRD